MRASIEARAISDLVMPDLIGFLKNHASFDTSRHPVFNPETETRIGPMHEFEGRLHRYLKELAQSIDLFTEIEDVVTSFEARERMEQRIDALVDKRGHIRTMLHTLYGNRFPEYEERVAEFRIRRGNIIVLPNYMAKFAKTIGEARKLKLPPGL